MGNTPKPKRFHRNNGQDSILMFNETEIEELKAAGFDVE